MSKTVPMVKLVRFYWCGKFASVLKDAQMTIDNVANLQLSTFTFIFYSF
jgi:hypothetical protein